jgi:hypothetical protein
LQGNHSRERSNAIQNLYGKPHGGYNQHMMMSGITGMGAITQADEQYNYSIPSE